MPEVLIDNVHKSFGAVEVLKGVSLSVNRGDVFALIGRSGSGKSTLLRCINGLEKINSGRIEVAGHAVGRDPKELRKLRTDVGIVFQSYNLFPHLTVGENIMLAPRIVKLVSKAEAKPLRRKFSAWLACRRSSTPIPTSFPAASSSAWRSPARSPCVPR
jgi:polar amino acid transport system ATP-binding protein